MKLTTLLFMICVALSVIALDEAAPAASIYDLPGTWLQHMQLKQALMSSIQSGNIKAMEETCRNAVSIMPADATWRYNLACALAYHEDPAPALAELEKAITLGFRNADQIAADSDLARIAKEPRFKELVEMARKLANDPIPGKPVNKPLYLTQGMSATLTETNLVWNYDEGVYIGLVRQLKSTTPLADLAQKFSQSKPTSPERPFVAAWLSEGSAAGNAGDIYMNRDGRHSMLAVQDFPLLSTLWPEPAAVKRGLAFDNPNTLFPGFAVFGNASRARTVGSLWRSIPRASMTDMGLAEKMNRFYLSNQFWVFPAHNDFGKPAIGDCFPAVAPFQFVTLGSSWSDQPCLRAALAASASFKPVTKKAILRRGLLAPTLQWLIRSTLKNVKDENDYLSPAAHPTAFDTKSLDTKRLVNKAHELEPGQVPPIASLAIINSSLYPIRFPKSGVDYADPLSEILFATPTAISFILRSPEAERTFIFRASPLPEKDPDVKFAWRIVHGDASAVKISQAFGERLETPETGVAQITIDRSKITNRIDVAVFAKTKGTDYGAPSFISFYPIPQETRVYDKKNRIVSIDYSNIAQHYTDPMVALPRGWKDTYDYTKDGRLTGFTRSNAGRNVAEFLNQGLRIVEKYSNGAPKKVVRVKYIPRNTGNPAMPLDLTYIDDGEPFLYNGNP